MDFMRLGFWNRMALVVGGLVTVVLPSWRVFSFDQQNRAAIKAGYDACIKAASEPIDWYAVAQCNEEWGDASLGSFGWKMWFESVAVTAICVIIVYLMIVALIHMGEWVWRGRNLPE